MPAPVHDLPILVLPLDPRLDQKTIGDTVACAGAGRTLRCAPQTNSRRCWPLRGAHRLSDSPTARQPDGPTARQSVIYSAQSRDADVRSCA